jgi:hypothetical protein
MMISDDNTNIQKGMMMEKPRKHKTQLDIRRTFTAYFLKNVFLQPNNKKNFLQPTNRKLIVESDNLRLKLN